MAVKINTTMTINGITLASGSICIPVVKFLPVVLGESGGIWNGTKTRTINVQLPIWGSKLLFQSLQQPFLNVDDFASYFNHDLSNIEYDSYTPVALDQLTLDFIELALGEGTCEIVDPYIVD